MWFPTSGILVSSHRNDGSLFSGTAVSKTPDTGVTEAGIFTPAPCFIFSRYDLSSAVSLIRVLPVVRATVLRFLPL